MLAKTKLEEESVWLRTLLLKKHQHVARSLAFASKKQLNLLATVVRLVVTKAFHLDRGVREKLTPYRVSQNNEY